MSLVQTFTGATAQTAITVKDSTVDVDDTESIDAEKLLQVSSRHCFREGNRCRHYWYRLCAYRCLLPSLF